MKGEIWLVVVGMFLLQAQPLLMKEIQPVLSFRLGQTIYKLMPYYDSVNVFQNFCQTINEGLMVATRFRNYQDFR